MRRAFGGMFDSSFNQAYLNPKTEEWEQEDDGNANAEEEKIVNIEYEYDAEDIHHLLALRLEEEFERINNVNVMLPTNDITQLESSIKQEIYENNALERTVLIAFDLGKQNWIGIVINIIYPPSGCDVEVIYIEPQAKKAIKKEIRMKISNIFKNQIKERDAKCLVHASTVSSGVLTVENLILMAIKSPYEKHLNQKEVKRIRWEHIELFGSEMVSTMFYDKQKENVRMLMMEEKKVLIKPLVVVSMSDSDKEILGNIIKAHDEFISGHYEFKDAQLITENEEKYNFNALLLTPLHEIFKLIKDLSWDIKNNYNKIFPWILMEYINSDLVFYNSDLVKFVVADFVENDCAAIREMKNYFVQISKKEVIKKESSKSINIIKALACRTYDQYILNDLVLRTEFLNNLGSIAKLNNTNKYQMVLAICRVLHCAGEYFKSLSLYSEEFHANLPKQIALDLRDALAHLNVNNALNVISDIICGINFEAVANEMLYFRNQLIDKLEKQKKIFCAAVSPEALWPLLKASVTQKPVMASKRNYKALDHLLSIIGNAVLPKIRQKRVNVSSENINIIAHSILPHKSFEHETNSFEKLKNALKTKDGLEKFVARLKTIIENVSDEQCKLIYERIGPVKDQDELTALAEKYALGLLKINQLNQKQFNQFRQQANELKTKRANLQDILLKLSKDAEFQMKGGEDLISEDYLQKQYEKLKTNLINNIGIEISPDSYWQDTPGFIECTINTITGIEFESGKQKTQRRKHDLYNIAFLIELLRVIMDFQDDLGGVMKNGKYGFQPSNDKDFKKMQGYILENYRWGSHNNILNVFRPILEKDAIKRQAAELLLVIISDGLAQMKRSDYPEMDNLFAAIESLRNFFAHPNPSGKSDFPIATPTRYINNYLSTLAQEVTIFSINIKFIFEEKFHINIDKTIFEVWAAFGTLPHKKIIIGNKQLLGVLPFESEQTIVKQIFSHLDRKTLHKSVPLVSKAWYRVYKDTAQNCGFNLRMSNLITPSIMKKSNNLLLQSKVACKSKVNHTFEFDGSSYVPFENIHVVGSFNYWLKPKNGQIDVKNKESDKWSMKRDKDNVWKLTCLLDFGEHEYKFIIDGERWVPDGINNNCKINIVNPRTSNSNAKAAMSLNPPKTNPAPMPSKILSVPVFQQGQPVSRQESVIDYANDAKDLNIANKYEDISYQLQAHDINYVADILFSKIGDKYFLPVQQYHLNHPSMDLKRTLRENREKLESGIELLSIFNKGGNHWVAFKVKKVGEKQLRVLYKDSFGHKYPPNFKDLIEGCFDKNYTVYFTYSISEEQNLSDGINCGIFAVRNLQVLANQGLADMLGDGEPGLSEGVMNARIKFFNMDVDDYLAAIRQDRHLFANLYLQRSKEIENESKERKDRITRLDNEVTNLMVISLMRNDYFQGLLTGSNKLLSLGFCSLPNSAGICFSINIYGKLIDSLPSFKQFLQNLSTPFTLTMEPGNTCTHFYIPYDDAIRLKSSMENNPREIDDLARALQNVGPPRLTL